jgi:hypothetical protein
MFVSPFRACFSLVPVLSVFLAICRNILELEAAISRVFAHFGIRTSHFLSHLQQFGARTLHVAFYFATGVLSGSALDIYINMFIYSFIYLFIWCLFGADLFRVCLGFL